MTGQITFKGNEYESHPMSVPNLLANEGLLAQAVIVGKRGATRFLQIWAQTDPAFTLWRTISTTGKVESEIKAVTK